MKFSRRLFPAMFLQYMSNHIFSQNLVTFKLKEVFDSVATVNGVPVLLLKLLKEVFVDPGSIRESQ